MKKILPYLLSLVVFSNCNKYISPQNSSPAPDDGWKQFREYKIEEVVNPGMVDRFEKRGFAVTAAKVSWKGDKTRIDVETKMKRKTGKPVTAVFREYGYNETTFDSTGLDEYFVLSNEPSPYSGKIYTVREVFFEKGRTEDNSWDYEDGLGEITVAIPPKDRLAYVFGEKTADDFITPEMRKGFAPGWDMGKLIPIDPSFPVLLKEKGYNITFASASRFSRDLDSILVILMAGKKVGKTEYSLQFAYYGRGRNPTFKPDSVTHFSKRYGNLRNDEASTDKAYQADFTSNGTDIYEGNFFPNDTREPTSRLPYLPPSKRVAFCFEQL